MVNRGGKMKFKLEANGRNIFSAGLYETATQWVVMWRFYTLPCHTAIVPKGTR
jgi:hypothetical protein